MRSDVEPLAKHWWMIAVRGVLAVMRDGVIA
jgi:hypothetical protein